MDKKFFSKNRTALMNKLDNNSIVILFAGKAKKKTGDQLYQFTPDRNFYYLTGIDEENIIISLYASSVSKARVITKINRITFENVIASLNVGSVVNPKVITADHITQYVRGMQNSLGSNVETLYTFAGGKAEALEFRVTKEFKKLNTPLADLTLKRNLLIACIYRQGKVIVPGGQDHLMVADSVIVVTTQTGLNDLNDVLE